MKALFIGRYQPFHDGHKKLMEVALDEGKYIVIALRDTRVDDKNPYDTQQRKARILASMTEYAGRVEVITIPDIAEVCYGRDVGYKVREIRLDEDTESISGTKIRALS